MLYFHKEYYNLRTLNDRGNKSKERMNYDSTIKTNLRIRPINQPETFRLYYVPTNDTIELISEISKLDILLENLYNDLPGLAQRNFFMDMLSMELQSTNELEGVRSSKDEIVQTARKVLKLGRDENIEARFINVIKSYFELKDGNLKPPANCKDFRKIYDEITADGILKEDAPDGEYFRKGQTYVYRNNKEIHRGLSEGEDTEKVIIEKVSDIFEFMDAKGHFNLHNLIKIAIVHYYFGYIHPFYDGNGRTGRFISSIYLKESHSWLTAMSLSQGCNKERSRYLKMFDVTNQISSQGEVNFFVDEFLAIILGGQQEILESLIRKNDLLTVIMKKIKNDVGLTNQDDKMMMSVMAQEYHFNPLSEGIGVSDLRDIFDYTDETIRTKLKSLFDRGLIEKTNGRPVKYIMSKGYLESSL